MPEEWITTAEAAELTGYTRRHVRQLITMGLVNGRKFGDVWQVNKASLVAYAREAEHKGEKRGPKPKA